VRNLKEGSGRIIYLTAEQTETLLEEADQNRQIYPFILIGLRTGMRRSEILSIRREHVDLAAHSIYVPHAKAEARTQPISANLARFPVSTSAVVLPFGTEPGTHVWLGGVARGSPWSGREGVCTDGHQPSCAIDGGEGHKNPRRAALRGDREMNEIAGTSVVPINSPSAQRVPVKLRRATDQFSKVCPSDGQGKSGGSD
jgi:Phage integrase family